MTSPATTRLDAPSASTTVVDGRHGFWKSWLARAGSQLWESGTVDAARPIGRRVDRAARGTPVVALHRPSLTLGQQASAHYDTQAEAIDRAREILGHLGGGELEIRGENGSVRQQDTVPPGNEPRSSAG